MRRDRGDWLPRGPASEGGGPARRFPPGRPSAGGREGQRCAQGAAPGRKTGTAGRREGGRARTIVRYRAVKPPRGRGGGLSLRDRRGL